MSQDDFTGSAGLLGIDEDLASRSVHRIHRHSQIINNKTTTTCMYRYIRYVQCSGWIFTPSIHLESFTHNTCQPHMWHRCCGPTRLRTRSDGAGLVKLDDVRVVQRRPRSELRRLRFYIWKKAEVIETLIALSPTANPSSQ